MVRKRSGANSVNVARAVKKSLEEMKQTMPPGVDFYLAWDISEMIERITHRTSSNAIVGGLLAMFMIYLFLRNWRPTLIISLAIPLSIIATFIALYSAGYTLRQLDLSNRKKILVIAIRPGAGGDPIFIPTPDKELVAGDILVTIGHRNQFEDLQL